MRFVRSPLRISIGGGGTDLPFYYKEEGADLMFASINHYIYIATYSTLDEKYSISLKNHSEETSKMEHISDEYVKTALELLNAEESGLDISSSSSIPSGTGLGSSGSFTVSLLKALEPYSDRELSTEKLAEMAFELEHEKLGKPCGKQDQYAAAFGGLKRLQIDENGETSIESLDVDAGSMKNLEERLMLFYTEERRYSGEILNEQKDNMDKDRSKRKKMDRIKDIGTEIREELEKGNISEYGGLLHKHWETKKKFTDKITNPKINQMYSDARDCGAIGGKIVGAGGGGFLMLYADKQDQRNVRKAMENHNAKHMEFKFEDRGCEVIHEG